MFVSESEALPPPVHSPLRRLLRDRRLGLPLHRKSFSAFHSFEASVLPPSLPWSPECHSGLLESFHSHRNTSCELRYWDINYNEIRTMDSGLKTKSIILSYFLADQGECINLCR